MLRTEIEVQPAEMHPIPRVEPDSRLPRGDFSFRTRSRNLQRLCREEFDVAVIGGGATGAGIARDAALRGMTVALIEKGDFAAGSSSKSSKMIHGGLRYLKQLEISLVREALHERAVLLRIAPHLVKPIPHLLPAYGGYRKKLELRVGMFGYEALAGAETLVPFEELSRSEVLQREPLLNPSGLSGGFVYHDCLVNDARLTLATIKSAFEQGAVLANYTECVRLEHGDGAVTGLRIRDVLTGAGGSIQARVVVNASGAWADSIRSLAVEGQKLLRPTKGIHVVVSREKLKVRHVVAHSTADSRAIFVVPRGAFTYIGTTDTDCDEAPESVRAEVEDVSYLLGAVNEVFEDVRLSLKDVLSTWAGLRPLIGDAGSPSSISRDYRIEVAPNGLVTVVGGKLTTYRSMAEAVVDEILSRFFPRFEHRFGESRTKGMPLPGGRISDFESYAEGVVRGASDRWGLTSRMVERLLRNYGTDYLKILALGLSRRELLEPLSSDSLVLKGEVVYAVEDEMAMTLEDFMERRTDLTHFDRDRGMSVAQEVARLMGDHLGWDEAETKRQLDRYRHGVTSHVAPGPGRPRRGEWDSVSS